MKYRKKQNFSALDSALDIVERCKEMWFASYLTCVDIIAQVSLTQ